MLWAYAGYKSYSEWCRARPGQIRSLRRLLLICSSGVYRKHKHTLFCFPWRLAALADERLCGVDLRQRIATKFVSTSPCCVKFGLARQLRLRNINVASLMGPLWRNFFIMMARLRTMQIADVERRHRRNRVLTQMHKSWHHFVASYIAHEAKALLSVWLQERHLLLSAMAQATAEPQQSRRRPSVASSSYPYDSYDAASRASSYLKKRSALQLFHSDCIQRNKILNVSTNPASHHFWAEVRREFDSLPQEQRDMYEARSMQSAEPAQQNRLRRKADQMAQDQAIAAITSLPSKRPRGQGRNLDFGNTPRSGLILIGLTNGSAEREPVSETVPLSAAAHQASQASATPPTSSGASGSSSSSASAAAPAAGPGPPGPLASATASRRCKLCRCAGRHPPPVVSASVCMGNPLDDNPDGSGRPYRSII